MNYVRCFTGYDFKLRITLRNSMIPGEFWRILIVLKRLQAMIVVRGDGIVVFKN